MQTTTKTEQSRQQATGTIDDILAQAREIQRNATEVAYETSRQLQPMFLGSLHFIEGMQACFSNHLAESSNIAAQQTRKTLEQMTELMRASSAAACRTLERSREQAQSRTHAATGAHGTTGTTGTTTTAASGTTQR